MSAQAHGLAMLARRAAAQTPASLSPRREARLVRAAEAGDTEAVEILFAAYWPMLHRAAWLITRDRGAAEDIAQEAFLAALAALGRFDRTRRLGPWLRTIVARRAIDHARARAVRREVELGPSDPAAGEDSPPPSSDLITALNRLDHDRRSVIVLRYLLDLTPAEIARELGLPVGTVNSRLRRGLDQLETYLEHGDG